MNVTVSVSTGADAPTRATLGMLAARSPASEAMR